MDQKSETSSESSIRQRHNKQLNGYNASKDVISDDWTVCQYSSLPKWLQDNNYLHGGHRPPLPSIKLCFKSIFRLHSETGNILTHGLGFVLFLMLAIVLLTINKFKTTDKLMISTYFFGAIACHLLSSVYHVCKCHSPEVSQFFHRLDYCGISLQIICSMIPAFYYGFYNNPKLIYVYNSLGIALFITAFVISLWPKFGRPKYRPLRAFVFLSFGLSNIIPGIHWLLIIETQFIYPFSLVVIQGALYVVGALFYAGRVPEKYFPGKCDYFVQSHQIFHSLVTIAAIVHFMSIYTMLGLRNN